MEAMLPVEKKADCRRTRKKRAVRMEESVRLRLLGGEVVVEEVEVEVEVGVPSCVWVFGVVPFEVGGGFADAAPFCFGAR